MNPAHPLLITLEGTEGAGKSTQIRRLAEYLQTQGLPVLLTREPGGTPLGKTIRSLVFDPDTHPLSQLFLFAADRAQHITQVIEPALQQNQIVLCDRYTDSTIAYQYYGNQVSDWDTVINTIQSASKNIRPNITLWLDLPVKTGLHRAYQRDQLNVFELKDVDYHINVRRGYTDIYVNEPERVYPINANQPEELVFESICQCIQPLLNFLYNHHAPNAMLTNIAFNVLINNPDEDDYYTYSVFPTKSPDGLIHYHVDKQLAKIHPGLPELIDHAINNSDKTWGTVFDTSITWMLNHLHTYHYPSIAFIERHIQIAHQLPCDSFNLFDMQQYRNTILQSSSLDYTHRYLSTQLSTEPTRQPLKQSYSLAYEF